MTIASTPLFNPQGGYASFVVPAAFVLILQQTLLMGIGILHSGRQPSRSGAAAALAYILLYCFWIAVTLVFLPYVLGIPRIGGIVTLYLVAVPSFSPSPPWASPSPGRSRGRRASSSSSSCWACHCSSCPAFPGL
ncbi:hypothetical protein HED54_25525 [Ochrobactrum anthropi ATCC 49188]|nr:hypothetical protein [Brucella anthropi ATCC 49188]